MNHGLATYLHRAIRLRVYSVLIHHEPARSFVTISSFKGDTWLTKVHVAKERIYEFRSDQIINTTASLRACRTLDECIVTLIRLTAEVQGLRCGALDRCRTYSQGKKEKANAYHTCKFLLPLSLQWENFRNKRLATNENSEQFFMH